MKNIKTALLLGAAALAICVSASANVYTDTNTHNLDMYEGDTFTGHWTYGPIAANQTVTKVETWFKFSSSDTDYEQVHIDLGTGEGVTDYSNTSGTINFGSNYTIDWVFNTASLLADAANGTLNYTITAIGNSHISNDFTFNTARVDVTTITKTTQKIPDGGATIALLGLSLVALAGAQRKFRSVR